MPACGEHRTITNLVNYQQFCGIRSKPRKRRPTVMEGQIEFTEGHRSKRVVWLLPPLLTGYFFLASLCVGLSIGR
jgi:hypothetical protein